MDDWFSKYQEEKTKLNQLLSEKLEVNADKISGIKPFDIHTNIETQINSLKVNIYIYTRKNYKKIEIKLNRI